MAFVVLSEASPLRAMEAILRRSIYVLLPLSLVLIKYFPAQGVEFGTWSGARAWIGVTTQKNGLGRLCVISAFSLIWMLMRRSRQSDVAHAKHQNAIDAMMLLLALYLIKGPPGGYSATSVTTLAAGLIILWSLSWMRGRGQLALSGFYKPALLALLITGVALPIVGTGAASRVALALGRDASFTGRSDIWEALVPKAMKTPVLGAGYGSFWIDPGISFRVNEAHSGYLEVWLELGAVGVILLGGVLVSTFLRAHRNLTSSFRLGAFTVCFIVMAALHNITEASFVRASSHIWTIAVVLTVLCGHSHRRCRSRRRPHVDQRSPEFGQCPPVSVS
jgi:O-antigen ligase